MSTWRYNPAEDDYEEIPPEEPDYCATCSCAGRCAGYCAVPPDLT